MLTWRKEEDEIVFEMKPATDLYRHSKTQQKINCTLSIHWVFTGLLHAALWERTFEKVELKKDHVEAEITQKLMMKWEPVWMRSLMRIVSWLLTKSFEEDKQQNLMYMTAGAKLKGVWGGGGGGWHPIFFFFFFSVIFLNNYLLKRPSKCRKQRFRALEIQTFSGVACRTPL